MDTDHKNHCNNDRTTFLGACHIVSVQSGNIPRLLLENKSEGIEITSKQKNRRKEVIQATI